jgi:hypothetical protein
MRTLRTTLALFVVSLMLLPAAYAQNVKVGLNQVIVNVKGRHKLNNSIRQELFTANVTRSHDRASTADLSARRAAGKLARQLKQQLTTKFGAKGAAIARTIAISNQAEMTNYSYYSNNKNAKVDRATYQVSLTLPLKGNKRVRGMLRDLYQDVMKPEYDRWGYQINRGLEIEAKVDQKAVDKAVAQIAKERIAGARKIAQTSLRELGRTGKLQGVEIQSYNWTWRGPTEVDVSLKAAFGFQGKK